MLYMGDGTQQGNGARISHEAFMRAGIKSEYYESPGTAHEWLIWRRNLNEFAPQ